MDSAAPRGPDRRKEWRAVPQEPDHGKHGHSDERTIYEGRCRSITIDGGDDMLRERLQDVARQQQELLQGSLGRLGGMVGTSQEVGRREESGEAVMAVRHQQGLVPQKEVSACGMQLLANVPAAGNKEFLLEGQ